jgi:hypothetical protein
MCNRAVMVKEWVYRWSMVNSVVLLIDKRSSKWIGQPLMAVLPNDAEPIANLIFLTSAMRRFCGGLEGQN